MTLALELRGLRVAAGDRDLLRIEALDLPAGARIGVAGPSGAGKTTLLHALAGLVAEMSGRVAWDGTDLAALSPAKRAAFRARHVGLIFQDFLLFEEMSALANAAIATGFAPAARRPALRDEATAHLERLGLDPQDPRPVARLSGGERQRVAVARALTGGAGILLADEPTASLHRAAADRLADDLCALARDGGTTLVAVSHDPALLERMDRVLTVEDGRLAGDAARRAA